MKRQRTDYFALVIVGCLALFALFLAFGWWMSPFGIGFAVADPPDHAWRTYEVSYFGGIPMMLLGQLAAALLAITGRRRAALWVAAGTIVLFLCGALSALGLLGLL